MKRLVRFFNERVAFVSWHRHWKGIYVHCISRTWCHRFFLWGHDKHRKANKGLSTKDCDEAH